MPNILVVGDEAGPCVAVMAGTGSVTVAGVPVGAIPTTTHTHGGLDGSWGCIASVPDPAITGITAEGLDLYAIGLAAECELDFYERSPTHPAPLIALLNRVSVNE